MIVEIEEISNRGNEMNQIARAQKAAARREYEQSLIALAGDCGRSNFLASLLNQSMIQKRYLSTKQMAVIQRMITERES